MEKRYQSGASGRRQVLSLWSLGLAVLAIPLPGQDVSSPMDEMRAIEAQIRLKLREQAERESRMQDIDQSLRLAEEMLRGNTKVRRDNKEVLRGIGVTLDRNLSVLQDALEDSRAMLDHARNGAQLAAAMTLQNARDRGPNDRRTALAAILQSGHREQAQLAVEQSLRLEEIRTSKFEKREGIQKQVNRYESLGNLSVAKLRERYRELSSQVGKLQALSSGTRTTLAQLEARRQALTDLVEGLAAGTLDAAEIEALGRSATPGPTKRHAASSDRTVLVGVDEMPPPPPDDLPEIPYDDTQTELRLGTRQGDGGALLSMNIPAESGLPADDGWRKSFWMPERVVIHALAGGRVLFGGGFAGYRHLLVIDHGGGWTTLYGNMEGCNLLEGAEVVQGQALGSYQTTDASRSEPFWIEVREQTVVVDVSRLPGAGKDWEQKLFSR